MKVTVQRLAVPVGTPVMGSLTVTNGTAFRIMFRCSTLERPDTLIAPGTYRLAMTRSPKFSRAASIKAGRPVDIYTPEILDVPGRAGLRIHVANYTRQLQGCIAPGYSYQDLDKDGKIDISQSTAAYDALLDCLWTGGTRSEVHTITIRNAR